MLRPNKGSLHPRLGNFPRRGSEFELDLLGAEIGVSGSEFHGAGLFLSANPDGAGAADQRERIVADDFGGRSEEHTSELQSRENLVCRLLLEKKKKKNTTYNCSTR